MVSMKGELALGSTASAFVLLFALAWGSPFVGTARARAQDEARTSQQQQQPSHPATGTFTGTVARSGDQYVLRDSSGETFRLDDAERARAYEGKAVKITGELNEQAKLIHVESIVSAEG